MMLNPGSKTVTRGALGKTAKYDHEKKESLYRAFSAELRVIIQQRSNKCPLCGSDGQTQNLIWEFIRVPDSPLAEHYGRSLCFVTAV